jgi:hypothetical protein
MRQTASTRYNYQRDAASIQKHCLINKNSRREKCLSLSMKNTRPIKRTNMDDYGSLHRLCYYPSFLLSGVGGGGGIPPGCCLSIREHIVKHCTYLPCYINSTVGENALQNISKTTIRKNHPHTRRCWSPTIYHGLRKKCVVNKETSIAVLIVWLSH